MEGISLPYIFPLLRSQTGICMGHVGQEDMAQLVAGTIPGVSHHISRQSHWRIAFGALTLVVGQDGRLSQSCAQYDVTVLDGFARTVHMHVFDLHLIFAVDSLDRGDMGVEGAMQRLEPIGA
jgi:hypothetical protein